VRRWSRTIPWVGLGLAVLVAAAFSGSRGGGPALDPDSTGPAGARALLDTVRRLGATVRVVDEVPTTGDDGDRVLVLDDRLTDDQRRQLGQWVEAGGVLVVADPSSVLSGTSSAGGFDGDGARADCDLAAVAGAERVSAPVEALSVPAGATACFGVEDGAWLVVQAFGDGQVVALGGAAPLLNAHLDRADNAVVAAGLLVPDGTGTVVVLRPSLPGAGSSGLGGLLPDGVRAALWQVLVAGVVLGIASARRVGRPIVDDHLVRLDAAALVLAASGLHQRRGHNRHAVAIVAEAARRDIAANLGLGSAAGVDAIVEAAASRGRDTDGLQSALDPSSPTWDTDPLAAARSIHEVRQRTLHPDV